MTSHGAEQHDADDRPILAIERLTMRFGRQVVLRGIDLRFRRGETVAILGESGCGKTVLLKTIMGLLKPTMGTIRFDGIDLAGLSRQELTKVRVRFGFVFQQAALFDSMTIGDNVAFPLRQHTDKSEDEIRAIVSRLLAEVGLPDSVVTKKPAELSGGMRKRVGLARALALEPEVVLYDEPTTGLDPIMSDVVNELMLAVRKKHPVTGIIVTHDMRTAQKVADRTVMLYPVARLKPDEPQVLYDGPSAAIEQAGDPRVRQFVRGEAGERLMEMRKQREEANHG
ncbi:MAG: ATP-binding cassette domain-containing protein [Planctomycetota bacterium]|nr:MAG: ATP-binding cassette domain-containing protein [Planctomycetota bacterium]